VGGGIETEGVGVDGVGVAQQPELLRRAEHARRDQIEAIGSGERDLRHHDHRIRLRHESSELVDDGPALVVDEGGVGDGRIAAGNRAWRASDQAYAGPSERRLLMRYGGHRSLITW
jgi:hypothetical protein